MGRISQLVDRIVNPIVIADLAVGHQGDLWRVIFARAKSAEPLFGKACILVRMPWIERISPARIVPRLVHVLDIDSRNGVGPGQWVSLLGAQLAEAVGDVLRRQVLGELRELHRQPFLRRDNPRIGAYRLRQLEIEKQVVRRAWSRFGRSGERIRERKPAIVIPEAKAPCPELPQVIDNEGQRLEWLGAYARLTVAIRGCRVGRRFVQQRIVEPERSLLLEQHLKAGGAPEQKGTLWLDNALLSQSVPF